MTCHHEDCPATKECVRLIWLASTDAVMHPEYLHLLEGSHRGLVELSPCPGECLFRRALPETCRQSLTKIFLRRLLSNPQTPGQALRRTLQLVVADSGDGVISDVVAELAMNDRELGTLKAMNAILAPD